MNADDQAGLGALVWCMVYAGLSAFFVVNGRLFPRRGYELLGAALGFLSLSALGLYLLSAPPSSLPEVIAVQLVVYSAAFAPALHTHFLCYFSGRLAFVNVASWGYVLAAGGALAQLFWLLGWDSPAGPPGRTLPPGLLAGYFIAICGLHIVLGAALLYLGVRAGRRRARLPLICLTLLGPAIVFDFYRFALLGQRSLLTEAVVWIYALSIVWGLLSELRGAEGLLKETTSSLAEKTAELQVSYAELEMVHTELSRKEQLAAVGELAAAIAHEVRNPLAIIMNAASGLRRDTLSEEDKSTLLSIVDEESERLNGLVTELLRFARPVQAARAPVSLKDLCEKVQSAAPDGYEIRIHVDSSEHQPAVWVDPGLFRLALDNLVANAVQAMPEGGTIALGIGRRAFPDGEEAEALSVSDHGQGMTGDELERARKPFFTTKPRGTGLGLPIAERIVDAHGGQLVIESEKGKGTRVTLLIPSGSSGDGRPPGSTTPSTRRRRMTIPPGSSVAVPPSSGGTLP